jgi:hypothetical protein
MSRKSTRAWVLVLPLAEGPEFFEATRKGGEYLLTPFPQVARRFQTAGAAYDFAAGHLALQDFIVRSVRVRTRMKSL